MSIDKRVALVTGSSSGIGRAEAIALAKAGYDVVVNFSRSEADAKKTVAECERAGAETLLVRCDVSDEKSVIAMIDAVRARFGRLDVLCNNAGNTIKTLARDFEKVAVPAHGKYVDAPVADSSPVNARAKTATSARSVESGAEQSSSGGER